MRDLEDALLTAIFNENDDVIPLLIVSGAWRLNGALYLAIQLERVQCIAMLTLCKATIIGDYQLIRSLLSEPPDSENTPWYMKDVYMYMAKRHNTKKMSYPIALSIVEKNYEATKELLLKTDLDMRRKQVDWSKLKLTLLHPTWMYSIAPWVVSLKLVNNHLRKLPEELSKASQLRRLDLSHNLLESVQANLFEMLNLEYLNLSHNHLRELPETDKWSPQLLSLDLTRNSLSTLPNSIQHSSLEILILKENQFTSVPRCLCRIQTLTSLDLSHMPISSLPKEMDLEKLVNLNVTNTNIKDLPVHGFFKAQTRSSKPCNYVKVVIVCQSDMAKSVMYSRLGGAGLSTSIPDVGIFQWSYKPKLKRLKLYFNTWVLGSSTDYSPILPCFFSPCALYLVIWDMTRTGEMREQIKPYVDLLARYVPGANILIVAILPEPFKKWTEALSENLSKRLSQFFSKPTYQILQYHGNAMLSVTNATAQVDVKQKIYEIASTITVNGQLMTGRNVPESYFDFIPIITKEQQMFRDSGKPGVLDENTLWNLFERALPHDSPDRMELPLIVDFLQEAGLLLHYSDPNHQLDQYYFIRPEWLFATIFRVLHHTLQHSERVTISYTELCSLADLKLSQHVSKALIRLMVRYTVVLPIRTEQQFLIPHLLPHCIPPSSQLLMGSLRRQFAPKTKALPAHLWYRVICHILANLLRITEMTTLKVKLMPFEGSSENPSKQGTTLYTGWVVSASETGPRSHENTQLSIITPEPGTNTPDQGKGQRSEPALVDRVVKVWNTGLVYDNTFSVFSCFCEMSSVEERGIEICTTKDTKGRIVMARLCKLIQNLLQERYPDLFSVDVPLHKHELTQLAVCPICIEKRQRNPTNFLIETCVHAKENKNQHCRYHSETIPLQDLIPDYLMVDFPSSYNLSADSFEYNQSRPLHRRIAASLYNGKIRGQEVAVKIYSNSDGRTITSPLSYVRQEMEMLFHLKHPSIVRTFGFCLSPPCVLLEKAPMGNLQQKLMDTEQHVSRAIRFHIGFQVASALEYLHRKEIIYRTLKASSILVWSLDFADEVNIKLTNFERAGFRTPSGLVGKLNFAAYHAPEMLRYSFTEEYTEKVDIYSFGMLLYELVTCQPDQVPIVQQPKMMFAIASGYGTMTKLMQECWNEDQTERPTALFLTRKLSHPATTCHISTSALRDCISVRGCCYVPSVHQIWVYGEYDRPNQVAKLSREASEGTHVFIMNAQTLSVQGSLELKECANSIHTIDNKVLIGVAESCVHAYDTTTFKFTDRLYVRGPVTSIIDNETFVFIAQANGVLTYYPKLKFPKESRKIIVASNPIRSMILVGESVWMACGNEIVVVAADDDKVTVVKRWEASESDHICTMVYSEDLSTVWSLVRLGTTITSWDSNMGCLKQSTNYSQELKIVCCDLSLDPSRVQITSMECILDTLWVGLSSGAIVILSAEDTPQVILFFKAHKKTTECLMKIPQTEVVKEDSSVVLSGGYGEVSFVSNPITESNGVVMTWEALSAEHFRCVASRYHKYYTNILPQEQ